VDPRVTYCWLLNGDTVSFSRDQRISGLKHGDKVSIRTTSGLMCAAPRTATDSIAIVVYDPVQVKAHEFQTVVKEQLVKLHAEVLNPEPGQAYTYKWTGAYITPESDITSDTIYVKPKDTYTYRVEARSEHSCVGYDTVTVEVYQQPRITRHPDTTSACEYDWATFSVQAIGGGLSYQWYVQVFDTLTRRYSDTIALEECTAAKATPYVGVHSATLTIGTDPTGTLTNVAPLTPGMDRYRYLCKVSGLEEYTPVMSRAARLTVHKRIEPVITGLTHSAADTVCFGTPDTLRAQVKDAGLTPTFRWYINGERQPEIVNTLIRSNFADGDSVVCIVESSERCVWTGEDTAALKLNRYELPHIVLDPAEDSNCLLVHNSDTVIKSFVTGGAAPYYYRWTTKPADRIAAFIGTDEMKDIEPAVNGFYRDVLRTPRITSYTDYTLTVTDLHGCRDTATTHIILLGGPLKALPKVTPAAICIGDTAQLLGAASGGSGNYTYAWKEVGTAVSELMQPDSQNTAVYPLPATLPDSTTYRLTVEDGISVDSADVRLLVKGYHTHAGTVTADATAVCDGDPVTFTVHLTTDNPDKKQFTYQWYVNDRPAYEATGTKWTTTGLHNGDSVYCEITSTYQCVQDRVVYTEGLVITVFPLPDVFMDYRVLDTTICLGDSIMLTVDAPTAVAYAWTPAESLLTPGNRDTVWARPSLETKYEVTVTDINGCMATDTAHIHIQGKPVVLLQPTDTAACSAYPDTMTFSVKVQDSLISTYQWQVYNAADDRWEDLTDSEVYGGTNTTDLTVVVTDLSLDSNRYRVYIANPCFDTVSAEAVLYTPDLTLHPTILLTDTAFCYDNRQLEFNAAKPADALSDMRTLWRRDPACEAFVYDGMQSRFLPVDCGLGDRYTAPVLEPGEYTYYAYLQGRCLSHAYDSMKVTVHALPEITMPREMSACVGDLELTAEATGEELTYLWSTGETTQTIHPYHTAEAIYTVVVTDKYGCSATASTHVSAGLFNGTHTAEIDDHNS
ncbi:MAG: hypothetical protein K2I68_05980, partial [Bacteroidales bacterium]|nr:hypothetical protein [Bacteroidales bacterium]